MERGLNQWAIGIRVERVLFCLAQSAKGVIVYILAKQSWSEKACKCYNVQLHQKGCVLLICPCLLIEWKGYFSKKHFWSAMGMRLPHTVEPGGCFFRECPPWDFWQLSVPIFITHYSLLQRVNNSWIFNRNIATRVNHLHWGNHAKPYALITKTYALIGKFEKCACTKVELERWKRWTTSLQAAFCNLRTMIVTDAY